MDSRDEFPRLFQSLRVVGAIVGVIGVLLLVTEVMRSTEEFYQAYLYGWTFWISMTVGCYGLMLLQNMVRAVWGWPVIRMLEAGARLMPFMGLAYIPIVVAVYTGHLYPWANPARVAADPVLLHRAGYMNPNLFLFRNIVYFVYFSFWAFVLPMLSRQQDATGDLRYAQSRINLAAPNFLVMVILLTFAVTDWSMTLEPHWYSTIYPFWFCVCAGMTALSFVVLINCVLCLRGVPPYSRLVDGVVTRDQGNLLLTHVMVWGYFSVSQFIIMWSGNLPNEVVYYFARNVRSLAWITALMVTFEFFVPFTALLSGRTKRTPQLLILVCIDLLLVRILEVGWNIVPSYHNIYAGLSGQLAGLLWLYCGLALVGIGGLWMVGFVTFLSRSPLVPAADPVHQEVLQHA